MTDNVATLAGYTKEVHISNGSCDLFLLVKPNTEYEGTFRAWDMDNQEFISVNGWYIHELIEV